MIKSNQIECSNKYSKVHRLGLCETAVQNIPNIPKENSAVLSVHPSLSGLWELEVFLTLLILLKNTFSVFKWTDTPGALLGLQNSHGGCGGWAQSRAGSRAPHPSRGCSSNSEPPSNSSSFTWQGLILLAETSAGFVSAGSHGDSPQKALQSREEEEECAVSDLEEAGHCRLLSMGCDSMALHSTGSRSCRPCPWAEPAHLNSTEQVLAAGSGHRVSLQSKTKAGLCGPRRLSSVSQSAKAKLGF